MLALTTILIVLASTTLVRPEATTITELPLDVLISRLPFVGDENVYDKQTQEWVDKPEVSEFVRRIAAGVKLSDKQWRAVLLGTGILELRERWPVGMPYAVSLTLPVWLDEGGTIELRPVGTNLDSAHLSAPRPGGCGLGMLDQKSAGRYLALGQLELGEHALELDVRISRVHHESDFIFETRLTPSPLPTGVLWQGVLKFPIVVVPTLDDAIPRVLGPEIDGAVRASLSAGLSGERSYEGNVSSSVLLDADPDRHPILGNTALSLSVEILRMGVVFDMLELCASPADAPGDWGRPWTCHDTDWCKPFGETKDPASRSEWSVRVRGNSSHVLACWKAAQWWSGELEIPLEELVARGK
jgi:hypothetical protein